MVVKKYSPRHTVLLAILLLCCNLNIQAQVNYIRTWTATAPEQNANTLISRPISDAKQVTQYVDGLGRPVQTVAKQGSLEQYELPALCNK